MTLLTLEDVKSSVKLADFNGLSTCIFAATLNPLRAVILACLFENKLEHGVLALVSDPEELASGWSNTGIKLIPSLGTQSGSAPPHLSAIHNRVP